MYPRSKHWFVIFDYVIVRRRDRQDVRVTNTICGADCQVGVQLQSSYEER